MAESRVVGGERKRGLVASWREEGARLESLEALPIELQRLELRGCSVRSFGAFPPLLVRLSLVDCGLRGVPHGLPATLEELDVSGNELRSLGSSLPDGLRVLRAVNNKIEKLHTSLRCTREVDLRGNRLRAAAFSSIYLERLELSENELEELTLRTPALRRLAVAYNRLASLSLDTARKLVELVANNNRLRSIHLPPGALMVNLARNELTDLPAGGRLRSLNLDGNQVRRVDRIPADLVDLSLRDNPLQHRPQFGGVHIET